MPRRNRFVHEDDTQFKGMWVVVYCLIVIVGLSTLIHTCTKVSIKYKTFAPDCSLCHSAALQKQHKMAEYFRKKGNPTPEVMAEAVMKTKSPRLMAAIAVRGEKNTPHWVRKGGYKRGHAGAWQVNQRDWGAVPYDVAGQAKQAESVLEALVAERGGLIRGLNNYGGDKTRQVYALNILKELEEVPR